MINNFVEHESLLSKATLLAERIAEKSAPILSLSKEAINFDLENDIEKGSDFEAELFSMCFCTSDQQEGMDAFLNKRRAKFRDI